MFAVSIGTLTARRVRSDFNHELDAAASNAVTHLKVIQNLPGQLSISPDLNEFVSAPGTIVRLITADGQQLAPRPSNSPSPLPPALPGGADSVLITWHGYLMTTRPITVGYQPGVLPFGAPALYLQFARPLSQVNDTVERVKLFLLLGVLGGTGLAFGAGAMIARRAMRPIADLTAAARDIERTRDANTAVPAPPSDDEVAELAHTLQAMLSALADARAQTEAMLTRQREFVADASHELRTPLTSVLANLELLSEQLPGEDGQSARSALRSSQRMRRLVEDLLLLARADTGRAGARGPLDLADVLVDAAAELGPISVTHNVVVDAAPAPMDGARDDLQRVAINLIENAVRHTPPGTEIRASTAATAGDRVRLVVEDDGPGVPDSIAPRLFERFVRGSGDRGGSFGLGLSIVAAVAEAHGGTVSLERSASGGARFVVDLPAHAPSPQHETAAPPRPAAAEPAAAATIRRRAAGNPPPLPQ